MEKPPLGLMPKFVWENNRRIAIEDAVKRYNMAKMPIPSSWIDELGKLPKE